MVVVPKGTDFCVSARLRRVCLLDSPPGPLSFDERFNGELATTVPHGPVPEPHFPAGHAARRPGHRHHRRR